MPEGTQLIALTKTFASQILKDYPDSLGDTGFDSIGEFTTAKAMAKFLDRLNSNGKLTKTILL